MKLPKLKKNLETLLVYEPDAIVFENNKKIIFGKAIRDYKHGKHQNTFKIEQKTFEIHKIFKISIFENVIHLEMTK